MNTYEYKTIKRDKLPITWRDSSVLNQLNDFLQQNWQQRNVIFDDERLESKQQFLSFKENQSIHTEGYIGTIVFKNEQLNIYPRVFKEDKDDDDAENLSTDFLMSNLIQWLTYCNKINYPFININTDLTDAKNLVDLFISLYVGYVDVAITRGLYFNYIDETKDLRTIKGKFNLKDYIVNKIPSGRANYFECTYSKFEFDNIVNRVIKHTCLRIFNVANKRNQKKLQHILMRLDEISNVICKPSDCDNHRFIRSQNIYKVIMSLSKMFLLNSEFGMQLDINDSFCFLFPTDLLFEGFIGGFIQDALENKGYKVCLQKSDMSLIDEIVFEGRNLGSSHKMRHDIYIEKDGRSFIMDTKYKEVSRFEGDNEYVKKIIADEIKQSDIYQVCEYARKRGLEDVYLLYPMFNLEDNEPNFPKGISKDKTEKFDINVHFVRLPFVFNDDIEITKNRLKNVINRILNVE